MSFLNQKVLVLNKVWQPVHIMHVRRAVTLVFKETARVVCPKSFQTYDLEGWLNVPPNGAGFIQTAKMKFSVPEVILLQTYSKIPMMSPSFSKRNVLKRDKYTCQYCGAQNKPLTIDHVVPRSGGGESVWENVVAACEPCNKKKGNKSLKECRFKLKKLPTCPTIDITSVLRRNPGNSVWKNFATQ